MSININDQNHNHNNHNNDSTDLLAPMSIGLTSRGLSSGSNLQPSAFNGPPSSYQYDLQIALDCRKWLDTYHQNMLVQLVLPAVAAAASTATAAIITEQNNKSSSNKIKQNSSIDSTMKKKKRKRRRRRRRSKKSQLIPKFDDQFTTKELIDLNDNTRE